MSSDGNKVITKSVLTEVVQTIKSMLSKKVDIDSTQGTPMKAATFKENNGTFSIDIETESNGTTSSYTLNFPTRTNMTVAALNDSTQIIRADAVKVRGIQDPDNGMIYMPGQETSFSPVFPGSTPVTNKGTILTTKFRAMDITKRVVNNGANILLRHGMFNQITGSNFTVSAPAIAINATTAEESWLVLDIPANTVPSITFTGFTWLSVEPTWANCAGYKFMLRAVNNYIFVVSNSIGANQPFSIEVANSGELWEAQSYANEHNEPFQWILTTQHEGDTITKPIWHTGNGKFIDALGYVISE